MVNNISVFEFAQGYVLDTYLYIQRNIDANIEFFPPEVTTSLNGLYICRDKYLRLLWPSSLVPCFVRWVMGQAYGQEIKGRISKRYEGHNTRSTSAEEPWANADSSSAKDMSLKDCVILKSDSFELYASSKDFFSFKGIFI